VIFSVVPQPPPRTVGKNSGGFFMASYSPPPVLWDVYDKVKEFPSLAGDGEMVSESS